MSNLFLIPSFNVIETDHRDDNELESLANWLQQLTERDGGDVRDAIKARTN